MDNVKTVSPRARARRRLLLRHLARCAAPAALPTSSENDERDGPSSVLEQTAARILALTPCRLLEIGCGTGRLLARIASACVHCTGVDFSAAALRRARAEVGARGLSNVTLRERQANDFGATPLDALDTIVADSVVQAFPSLAYLEQVLVNALHVLAPGGSVFVGNVRSPPRVAHEPAIAELSVQPEFFAALRRKVPEIASVAIVPRGSVDPIASWFAYDVVLRKSVGYGPPYDAAGG